MLSYVGYIRVIPLIFFVSHHWSGRDGEGKFSLDFSFFVNPSVFAWIFSYDPPKFRRAPLNGICRRFPGVYPRKR